MSQCDSCLFYEYDEQSQEYFCDCDMDEDELLQLMSVKRSKDCPYYRDGDEYKTVRHQI